MAQFKMSTSALKLVRPFLTAKNTQLLRPFSTTQNQSWQSAVNPDQSALSQTTLLNKTLTVPTFGGSLWVNTHLPLKIMPPASSSLDQVLDRAEIKVYAEGRSAKLPSDCDSLKQVVNDVRVNQEGKNLIVSPNADITEDERGKAAKGCRLSIKVPMIHNVKAIAEADESVEVRKFIESEYVNVLTNAGDIVLGRMRSTNIEARSRTGAIICEEPLQGAILLETESGNVIADARMTGTTVDIRTESGDIRVGSCYAESSKFVTNSGSMQLRNVHNESYVAIYEKGNLSMKGADGGLYAFVKEGDADVEVSRITQESRIHVEKGNLHLKLSDKHPLKVNITASGGIIPDTSFQKMGKLEKTDGKTTFQASIQPDQFSPSLTVIVEDGEVNVESQDWVSSLGLKGTMPDIK